jgi:hypothetical protein
MVLGASGVTRLRTSETLNICHTIQSDKVESQYLVPNYIVIFTIQYVVLRLDPVIPFLHFLSYLY